MKEEGPDRNTREPKDERTTFNGLRKRVLYNEQTPLSLVQEPREACRTTSKTTKEPTEAGTGVEGTREDQATNGLRNLKVHAQTISEQAPTQSPPRGATAAANHDFNLTPERAADAVAANCGATAAANHDSNLISDHAADAVDANGGATAAAKHNFNMIENGPT
jgi:hypothetical protein